MQKTDTGKKSSRPQAKGYSEAGASVSRRALKGFTPNSGSPNEDINFNNYTLRQRSRMLYMSSVPATAAINTNRTKVIGTGLTLKSTVNRDVLGITADEAKDWQRHTEAEFRIWAGEKQNCDALGINNFDSLQQLALKSWLLSGDVFALIRRREATKFNPYTLRIQLIEADRISTPTGYMGGNIGTGIIEGTVPTGKPGEGNKIYDGVEIDRYGQIVAYYVCNNYPYQMSLQKSEWIRVTAYGKETGLPNILQVMDSERPEQYRGVPYLAQVIEPLLQLRRYTESELMAALIQSFYTAWVTTETNQSDIPFNEVGSGGFTGLPYGDPADDNVSDDENEYELGPGTVIHLKEGENVNFGNPNIPTAGFETFVRTLCKLIGSALELPYEVLLKEFNSNYSASRAAIMEAWEAFKMRRKWFVDDFCQPIYRIWLSEAVAKGRIKAPGFFEDPLIHAAWCGARWIGPVQGQLDPKKEAEAAILLVNKGFKTYEQVTREIGGGDWVSNIEQLARENEMLNNAGGNKTVLIESEKSERGDTDNE